MSKRMAGDKRKALIFAFIDMTDLAPNMAAHIHARTLIVDAILHEGDFALDLVTERSPHSSLGTHIAPIPVIDRNVGEGQSFKPHIPGSVTMVNCDIAKIDSCDFYKRCQAGGAGPGPTEQPINKLVNNITLAARKLIDALNSEGIPSTATVNSFKNEVRELRMALERLDDYALTGKIRL